MGVFVHCSCMVLSVFILKNRVSLVVLICNVLPIKTQKVSTLLLPNMHTTNMTCLYNITLFLTQYKLFFIIETIRLPLYFKKDVPHMGIVFFPPQLLHWEMWPILAQKACTDFENPPDIVNHLDTFGILILILHAKLTQTHNRSAMQQLKCQVMQHTKFSQFQVLCQLPLTVRRTAITWTCQSEGKR